MAMTRPEIAAVIASLNVGDTVEVNWTDGVNTSTETGLVWQPTDSPYFGLGPDLLNPDDLELVGIRVTQRSLAIAPQPPLGSVAVFVQPGGQVIDAYRRRKRGWFGTGNTTPVPWTYLLRTFWYPDKVFVPGTPPGVMILNTLTPGDESITVAATLGTTGSSPIYDVQYRLFFTEIESEGQEDSGWISTNQATGNFVIPRLMNGVSFMVRVRAVNSSGAGPQSNLLTAVPVGLPGAPGTPTAVAGNTQATITWTAPVDNGGTVVTGYKVEKISAADNVGWIEVTASTGNTNTTYTVTGLTNGTAYSFRVSAINAVGTGLPSNSSVGVTPTT